MTLFEGLGVAYNFTTGGTDVAIDTVGFRAKVFPFSVVKSADAVGVLTTRVVDTT